MLWPLVLGVFVVFVVLVIVSQFLEGNPNPTIPLEKHEQFKKIQMANIRRTCGDPSEIFKDWRAIKGILRSQVFRTFEKFYNLGHRVGDPAVECRVIDLEGTELPLLKTFMRTGRPLVLNFGSYT